MSTRWQYHTVEIKHRLWGGYDPKVLQDTLTHEGLKGWELAQAPNGGGTAPMLLIYKKEI